MADEPQTFAWKTLLGEFKHHRAVGDVLHPEREPLEALQVLRQSLGEYHYAAQYQQNPAPRGGGMVKEEWFKRYRENELPAAFDCIIQSWDTAVKPSELSDYSVCTTWGVKGDRIYLLHLWRKQVDYPNLKRAVRQQYETYKPSAILIEDSASGSQLIQEFRKGGLSGVVPFKSRARFNDGCLSLAAIAATSSRYLHRGRASLFRLLQDCGAELRNEPVPRIKA